MAIQSYFLLTSLLLVLLGSSVTASSVPITPFSYDTSSLNRSSFPQQFVFGAAGAAYQYEGGAREGGRGPSNWDTFTHKYPEKIKDGSNGDVAVDSYHRYKEDVQIIKDMNLDAYRFSIAWSRILPKGKLSGGINKEGVAYYNNLTNELIAKGLQPFATLFHFDVPQALEDEYGGFLRPEVVKDFQDYADLCFHLFGDRIKHWMTINEPQTFTSNGYATGAFAPGRCSSWQNLNCTGGDSGTEPYLVSHYILLAHAAAVKVYKEKYQATQKGVIGIVLSTFWYVPFSNASSDIRATKRALDFMFGWYLHPLTYGSYPRSMRFLVGKRLPQFSEEQSKMLKGSMDFLGVNYYAATYAFHARHSNSMYKSYTTDSHVNTTTERNGIPIGPKAASEWLYIYPQGIRNLLLYVKKYYQDPVMYITENGIDEFNNASLPLEEALADPYRIDYHSHHLYFVNEAIKYGAKVKGYFAWSLLDNFEWSTGYTVRFGINFVDYKNGLKRYSKLSAKWFKDFLKK